MKDTNNKKDVIKLIEKYKNDPDFMKDNVAIHEDCLQCLETYCEYLDYIKTEEDEEEE